MTLRRYAPMAQSKGTVIPPEIRGYVLGRDPGCVGRFVGFPTVCAGERELDHVRASHGMGMKSESSPENLVALCGACHRYKTEHGRTARPLLLEYLERVEDPHSWHVDPVPGCLACYEVFG